MMKLMGKGWAIVGAQPFPALIKDFYFLNQPMHDEAERLRNRKEVEILLFHRQDGYLIGLRSHAFPIRIVQQVCV